jgi:two-component system, OmpR family, response regulator
VTHVIGDGDSRRVVVIEDATDVRDLLATVLGQAGWTVMTAASGQEGIDLVRQVDPDLITLDLALPDIDGMEVCRRLREFTDAYLVMLTARAAEIDRLLGLQLGADDYITKPFSPRELVARVGVLMRRPRSLADQTPRDAPFQHAGLLIDRLRRQVRVDDQPVELTKTEFDLLAELVRGNGRVWTRAELVSAVWGLEWDGGEHTVDVHMANLRRKLGQTGEGASYVETVRGVGFRLGG